MPENNGTHVPEGRRTSVSLPPPANACRVHGLLRRLRVRKPFPRHLRDPRAVSHPLVVTDEFPGVVMVSAVIQ